MKAPPYTVYSGLSMNATSRSEDEGGVNPTTGSILGFLEMSGPMTGWDLDQMIDTSIGNFWNVTRSQIYRELRELVARGYVVQGPPGPRSRLVHEITDEGRSAFRTWLACDPGPDVIRNRLLLTIFFGDYLEEDRRREILLDQRVSHVVNLTRYQELQHEIGTTGAMASTLRFGITYEEALIAWIDSLLESTP
ncbi:MAG TPA: PadR family transcriptional regulator [Acidimicrobiales bacterium]|nr:PadR family transcriptional regulator [Acidimicrobiales bacterium]